MSKMYIFRICPVCLGDRFTADNRLCPECGGDGCLLCLRACSASDRLIRDTLDGLKRKGRDGANKAM